MTYIDIRIIGRGIMVWSSISYSRRTNVMFLNGKQNHKDYNKTLNRELMSFACDIGGKKQNFPKRWNTIHTASNVKKNFTLFISMFNPGHTRFLI